MKKPKIAACMIVKNEEIMLPKCYETIKWVDELVIVDTGSTDSTPLFLNEGIGHKNKIISIGEYKWNDDFAEARNFALNKVTADWILTIDADEELLSSEDIVRSAVKDAEKKKIDAYNIKMITPMKDQEFLYPRLFRRVKGGKKAFWKCKVHNLIEPVGPPVDYPKIQIQYERSPAHDKDPDRALRMLQKAVNEDPKDPRMMYYFAREVSYKKMWLHVIYYLDKYFKIQKKKSIKEEADARLIRAIAYYNLGDFEEAIKDVGEAIALNPNFKEPYYVGADIEYKRNRPKYAKRWEQMAKTANNIDVLFVRDRENIEQGEAYYDKLFTRSKDMSRYEQIYEKIGEMVGNAKVLDIGCGLAEVAKHIKNYTGFDISNVAIGYAKKKGRAVIKGNLKVAENYTEADIYLMTEVIEHLKKPEIIFQNIPAGKEIIFSVPSFEDPAHVETYTEKKVEEKFGKYVNIKGVIKYGWNKEQRRWEKVEKCGDPFILLFRAVKR